MNEFTLLSEDQVFGDNKLDILKKYGNACGITDFAILYGGYISKNNYIHKGTVYC